MEQTAEPLLNHDDAMLEAFVQKPEKFAWYKRTFSKYEKDGIEQFAWSWSWWACFFSFWFLLYRKSYLAALGYFIAGIILSRIPFGAVIFMVVSGGTVPYFIFKTYRQLKAKVEAASPDAAQRVSTMKSVGGVNSWVVVVAVVIHLLVILAYLTGMLAIAVLLGQPH